MKYFHLFLIFFICSFGLQAQRLSILKEGTEIRFAIKNFGINTGGTLSSLNGDIVFDIKHPELASFNVTIPVNTINTGIGARDAHLLKKDYFDALNFPAIHFVAQHVKPSEITGIYTLEGILTIKNISKPQSIQFTVAPNKLGYVFSSNFSINRKDFSIGGNSLILSDNVNIILKVSTKL